MRGGRQVATKQSDLGPESVPGSCRTTRELEAPLSNIAGGFMARRFALCFTGIAALGSVLAACSAGQGESTGDSSEQAFGVAMPKGELIEAVTDGAVGLATVIGPPLAWYDQTTRSVRRARS